MANDIEVVGPEGFVTTSLAERMYPNMVSYAGQLSFMPNLAPRDEIRITRRKSVKAARQAERTSEALRGGREKHTDMVVGSGLYVRPTPDWDLLGDFFTPEERKTYANQCRACFNNWAFDPSLNQDAERHDDFSGLMWMAYHNLTGGAAETAGAILVDEDRARSLGARWNTFINVIDPARVQTPWLYAGREEELGIFEGRQLDRYGGWEGLYVLKKHPLEGGTNSGDFEFLPRVDDDGRPMAWHYFEKTEGGAQRGIARSLTILSRVFQMNKAYEGSVGAALLQSFFTMFVKSGADPQTIAERLAPNPMADNKSAFDLRAQFYKDSKIRFGGQRVPVLPDGDEIMFNTAGAGVNDPTNLFNIFMREFASNTGTTFEQIANNWSDANYSAARAAFEDIYRTVYRKRTRFANVPSLSFQAIVQEGIERKRIQLPAKAPPFAEMRYAYTKCQWMGPGKIVIDPQKEASANETNLRIKATTLDEIYAGRGMYYYDGLVQIAEEKTEGEALGLDMTVAQPGVMGGNPNDPNSEKPVDEPKPARKAKP